MKRFSFTGEIKIQIYSRVGNLWLSSRFLCPLSSLCSALSPRWCWDWHRKRRRLETSGAEESFQFFQEFFSVSVVVCAVQEFFLWLFTFLDFFFHLLFYNFPRWLSTVSLVQCVCAFCSSEIQAGRFVSRRDFFLCFPSSHREEKDRSGESSARRFTCADFIIQDLIHTQQVQVHEIQWDFQLFL